MLGNPPTIFTPTVSNGRLQDITAISNVKRLCWRPPVSMLLELAARFRRCINFNLGYKTKLPYHFRLDVSYVGSPIASPSCSALTLMPSRTGHFTVERTRIQAGLPAASSQPPSRIECCLCSRRSELQWL